MSLRFIVIDTNILISVALSPNGTAYQAVAFAIQEFILVQSDKTYQEIAQRIYKPKFDKYIYHKEREELLNVIQSKSNMLLHVQTESAKEDRLLFHIQQSLRNSQ